MYKSLSCKGTSILCSFSFEVLELLRAVPSKSSPLKLDAENPRHKCASTTINLYSALAVCRLQNSLIKCRSRVSVERVYAQVQAKEATFPVWRIF